MRGWWVIAAVCTACISENRRPVGDAQGDADGGPDIIPCDGCAIGDTCFGVGDPNPSNGCEACVPSLADDRWSPIEAGSDGPVACDDDDPCTPSGSCSQGQCAIPVAAPACGEVPECVASVGCDCAVTLEANRCLIDGVCYARGDLAPDNACMVCAPDSDAFRWTFATGRCDDGDACTDNDQCDQGQCAGAPKICADQVSCTTDFCDGGLCQHQLSNSWCLIEGQCFETGTASPDNPCMVCDPRTGQGQFSAAVGQACDDDDRCSSASACTADGQCVGAVDDVDAEPNDFLANAQDVGIVDMAEVLPSGSVTANLVGDDRDLFRWGMTLSNLGLFFEPKVNVVADGPTALEVCVYARCGQSAQAASKPTVTCASSFDRAQLDDSIQGCCVDVAAGDELTMILPASCAGATVQGFGYASVQPKGEVDAASCGGYLLMWGATD